MEPEVLFLHLQKPASSAYPVNDRSNLSSPIPILEASF